MKNIFFSWQSDLDSRTHRNYIEKCIKKSIKSINKNEDLHIYVEYDRDTLGLLGTPDISSSIFEKISKCALFVADISNITIKDSLSGMVLILSRKRNSLVRIQRLLSGLSSNPDHTKYRPIVCAWVS